MTTTGNIDSASKLPRRLAIILASVTTFIVFLLYAFPFFIPSSYEKSTIEKALGYVVGRPVQIMGSTSLSVFPSIQISASKIFVPSHSVTGVGSVLLDIEAIDFKLSTLALLTDEIDIETLHIQSPQIRLVKDKSGAFNWGSEANSKALPKKPDHDWGWWNDMQIGDVHISNGRLYVADEGRGIEVDGQNLNAKAFISNATGADKGLSITASTDINAEPVQLQIDIGAVDKLLTGGRLPVVAKLTSAFAVASYQGAIAKRQYFVSDGRFALEAPNIRQLEAWLGPVLDAPVAGGLLVGGRLNANGSRVSVDDLSITAGNNQITGRILLTDTANGRRIDADFKSPLFELDPFVSVLTSGTWTNETRGTINAKWSRLSYAGISSGPGEVVVSLKQTPRRIGITFPEISLFDGLGRAELNVGMGEGMTSVRGSLELNRIKPENLLENLNAQTTISGAGDIRLSLFSVGSSAAELLAALKGTGDFNFLAGSVHNEALAEYLLRGSPGQLDFTQLIGSFSVNQGIIEGNDLLLKAPSISLVGDGAVDLIRGIVDVRLQSLTNQKTADNQRNVSVQPFRISGTLEDVSIQLDED